MRRSTFCLAALLAVVAAVVLLVPSTKPLAQATADIGSVRCTTVPWWPCHNIALLELASTSAQAQDVVEALRRSTSVRQAAEENVERDFLLIPAYVAFLALLGATVAHLAELAELMEWNRLHRMLASLAVLQPVAGILGGLENVGLSAMLLSGNVTPCVHAWTLGVSTVKWWLIGIGLLVPIAAALVILACAALKCATRPASG